MSFAAVVHFPTHMVLQKDWNDKFSVQLQDVLHICQKKIFLYKYHVLVDIYIDLFHIWLMAGLERMKMERIMKMGGGGQKFLRHI